jgi:hypothetical protein
LSDELSPGGACGVDDRIVVFKDGVCEPVLAEILPDVFDRVQLRGAGRQEDRRNVVGHVELARDVPSGAVEDENGVGALGDAKRDFVEVELDHGSVGVRKHEGRPDAAGRADRAEQIGVVVAPVGRLPWPRSASGPLPDKAVLLADAGLVLKPDFGRRCLRQSVEMSLQRVREVFLKASTIRSS